MYRVPRKTLSRCISSVENGDTLSIINRDTSVMMDLFHKMELGLSLHFVCVNEALRIIQSSVNGSELKTSRLYGNFRG